METWKRGQIHLNSFWTIWSNEYLQSVRERHTLHMKPIKGEITRAPKLGEIVIIKEEGLSRGSWKLSRIEKLIESGIDGAHRAAILITKWKIDKTTTQIDLSLGRKQCCRENSRGCDHYAN